MAYKINRTIMINGQRKWIRADSEQEYFEKVVHLMGGSPTEQATEKHPFPEYAQKWFFAQLFAKSHCYIAEFAM